MSRFPSNPKIQPATRHVSRRPARRLHWGVYVLVTLFITLTVLQFSFRHGRLIAPPTYDDIGYFNDGIRRLQVLYDAGVPAFYQLYKQTPPHSPFSDLLAMTGFAIFGFHEWAPPAMNGLLVLIYLVAADRLVRRIGIVARVLCMLMMALLPFVGMAVQEFRPDFAVALFTILGAFTLLSGPFVYGPRKRALMAGVWFGIAMITKPPVFPQTLLIAGAALAGAILSDWLSAGKMPRPKAVVSAVGTVLIPFVLIPLPHYYLAWRHILIYINDVLFGVYKDSYQFKGSAKDHWFYYITGYGGKLMLGDSAWFLISTAIAGLIVLAILRPRRDGLRAFMMLGITLGAFLIATLNKTKQQFFGLGFQISLALLIVFIFSRLIAAQRVSRIRLLWLPMLALIVLVSVLCWNDQWPIRNGNYNSAWQAQKRQFVEEQFNTIISRCNFGHDVGMPMLDTSIPDDQKCSASTPTILFGAIGDFNPDIVTLMSAQKQLRVPNCLSNDRTTNINDFVKLFPQADFIFCAEPGTRLVVDYHPASVLLQPVVDAVRADHDFVEIGKWTFMLSTEKKSMYIFQRRPKLESAK